MLKCSGVYVSPVEVENCLVGHASVSECGVVGHRDEDGLEKAWAFVEVAEGVEDTPELREEIIAYAKSKISQFKAPRRVVVVPTLPRTETGKIRRAQLREMSVSITREESAADD
jgi:benzoate-CoA ligase